MPQRRRKQREGLAKQAEKHTRKIAEAYKAAKDSSDPTVQKWMKEIRTFVTDTWKKKK